MSADIIGIGLGILFVICYVGVYVTFLMSLSKLVDAIRHYDSIETKIHKAWIWTQLIPLWSFIGLLVLNIKLESASRAIENKCNLSNNDIKYPYILGWLVSLGFLYSWIPLVGKIAFFIFAVTFWVKVSSTTKQILGLNETIAGQDLRE